MDQTVQGFRKSEKWATNNSQLEEKNLFETSSLKLLRNKCEKSGYNAFDYIF